MPGTDARARARRSMHVLAREGWLDDDYIERYTLGFDALAANARATSRPQRVAEICGITPDRGRAASRATTRKIRPAAIRLNYGMQRAAAAAMPCARSPACRRSPATGAIRPAACCCRRAATSASNGAALYRPELLAGRTPRTINMSDDRPRPAARRPADRRADRLQQQPGRRRAAVARGRGGLRARGPVHRRARAVPDRHGRLRRLRAAGDDAARAHRRAQVVRPPLHAGEQPRDRRARRGAAEQRDLPAARREDGLRRAVLPRVRRRARGRRRLRGARRVRLGATEAGRLAAARPARRLRAVRQRAVSNDQERQVRVLLRGRSRRLGLDPLPGYVPPHEVADATGARGALSAGDDLAAGPQLPELHVRERQEPARRSKASRTLEIHPDDAAARGITDGSHVRVFNDRGSLTLQGARHGSRADRRASSRCRSGGRSSRATARTPTRSRARR